MAKMQISLNGSNFISENRQQSFKDALADDHQINCSEDNPMTVSPEHSVEKTSSVQVRPSQGNQQDAGELETQVVETANLDLALNHTYNHQQRTLEIHQQYISQQAEYIQLITAVLDQQGQAVKQQEGAIASNMVETFQRTLDNFHSLREQGVEIHREFLKQQTDFLERYLDAIENGHQPSRSPGRSAPNTKKKVTEWVVQQPPIVLDDQTPIQKEITAPDPSPPRASGVDAAQEKPGDIPLAELTAGLLDIVAEKTGYPAEMLELDMDLEADLGIDSIKRVEILGSLEEQYPALPQADTEVLSQTRTLQEIVNYMSSAADTSIITPHAEENDPAGQAEAQNDQAAVPNAQTQAQPIPAADLTGILLDIVADKTGYPAEMLELDMDMEADLGIDSIKRVEILGSMEESVPGLPSVPAESLAELRTLGQIVELMEAPYHPPSTGAADNPEEKKKDDQLSIDNTPVKLVSLPRPDHLDFTIPENRPLILTSDGSDLTDRIRSELDDQGWQVVIWEFPDQLMGKDQDQATAEGQIIKQSALGADAIAETLATLRTELGKPAGFIHLHPQQDQTTLFSQEDEGIIKEVFLIASAIQEDLNQIDPDSRNLFLNITRTDGLLGLHQQEVFVEGAGLTGLVKSLGWEWPDVFCRAIDFNKDLNETEISQLLVAEIHDPALGISEIGLGSQDRVTIKREYGSK